MKYLNKQILEAIQRGINIALDDYEDDVLPILLVGNISDEDYYKKAIKLIYKKIERKTDPLLKEELDFLLAFYKVANEKYVVKNPNELKDIIIVCTEYDPCVNLNWIDTSKITDMLELFRYTEFNGNISEWDVSHVKSMAGMFRGCDKFTGENTDLSNWNTKNVLNMSYMFSCSSFNGIHNDLANWDVSKVGLMEEMFSYCVFNSDISKWNVSKVENMKKMFMFSIFNKPIGEWNVSNVKESSWLFYGNPYFNHNLSKWKGEKLSISTFKNSALDLNHLPKYWQDDIKMHPQTQWK